MTGVAPAVRALVALGSNLPPRRDALRSAVAALAALPSTRLLAVSALRETEPLDCPPGSGPFVNGAALLETSLDPHELLAALADIEAEHGRRRREHHEPRRLDLDLIVHGDTVLDDASLTLPHPRAHLRLFVSEPAAELLPDALHPTLGRSWARLRDECLAAAAAARGAEVPRPPEGRADAGSGR